jgi:aldose 1-epimerase
VTRWTTARIALPSRVVLPLAAGDARAAVDPEGGGALTELSYAGFDLLTDAGCFVMAPWAGRTGYGSFTFEGVAHALPVPAEHAPHAIHGTVRQRPWIVESADPRQARLTVGLGPEWPWEGWCEQVVSLDPDSIRLELSVHSRTDRFPAVLGWHPWFADPDNTAVVAAALLQRGDDHLPTGVRLAPPVPDRLGALDDCFEDVQWPARLSWDEPALELLVEATSCDHVVVFNEIEGSTCVEPQTGPPDALRTGEATIVGPGEPLVASTTWRWRAT